MEGVRGPIFGDGPFAAWLALRPAAAQQVNPRERPTPPWLRQVYALYEKAQKDGESCRRGRALREPPRRGGLLSDGNLQSEHNTCTLWISSHRRPDNISKVVSGHARRQGRHVTVHFVNMKLRQRLCFRARGRSRTSRPAEGEKPNSRSPRCYAIQGLLTHSGRAKTPPARCRAPGLVQRAVEPGHSRVGRCSHRNTRQASPAARRPRGASARG